MSITQQQARALEALERVYYATHASFIDRNLVRQYIEQGADGWIAIPEGGMPPLGEQVLVWCKFGPHWGPMVDCWDEQHEAPLSFSSETIPIGPGWDSGSDFYDVTHWKPIGAPVAVQHPQQDAAIDAFLTKGQP